MTYTIDIRPIPTQPGMGRALINHDSRSRNYPARGVLWHEEDLLQERGYRTHYPYDQGQTSQCVAYSGKGTYNTRPFSLELPYEVRSRFSFQEWYDGAQSNDEWAGNQYDGTSALGLLRYLKSIGRIKEYRWCFGLADSLQTLSKWGPICVGSWWTEDMFHPDANGRIKYTGAKVGGHEWQVIGLYPRTEEIEMLNSWGVDWGIRGRARISFADFERILADDADVYTIVDIA